MTESDEEQARWARILLRSAYEYVDHHMPTQSSEDRDELANVIAENAEKRRLGAGGLQPWQCIVARQLYRR